MKNKELELIEKEIEKSEERIKHLKQIRKKLISVDDIKEEFYDTFEEWITNLYEDYRMISIYELMASPYDESVHMRRWRIYDRKNSYKLNKNVIRKRDELWRDMYRKTVMKATGYRVTGLRNKKGEMQVSKEEMETIRKMLIEKINTIFEEI